MKKKILAVLAATMAVGATCAFAANPFSDVPADSWAYQSVVTLAESGIIQGVDGTHFEGDRNITRYEAAEIVAKAMAHQDRATVEQRAMINKLADEFADELNSLGVRVSNLENRVGNVKLTGDARLRYQYQGDSARSTGLNDDNSWDYRIRLRANANVNDRTNVELGVSTNNQSFGSDTAASADTDSSIYVDRANVRYRLGGNTDLTAGRYNYILGNASGYQYGDTFDGAQLKYDNGKFAATAGYGKFKEGALNNVKTGYGELEGFFDKGSVGVYYNTFNGTPNASVYDETVGDTVASKDTPDDIWGAYGTVNLGQKWNLFGEYQRVNNQDSNTVNTKDADVWLGKLTYGKADFAAPKSWDAWVEYLDAGDGAYYGSTNSWRRADLLENVQSWGAGVDYTVAKNAQLQVMQSFASKTKDGSAADPDEQTRAQFVFSF